MKGEFCKFLTGLELAETFEKIGDSDLVQEIRERDLEHEFREDCYECERREREQSDSVIDEHEALEVYYAMHRGDMERVRAFVCAAAGRIA